MDDKVTADDLDWLWETFELMSRTIDSTLSSFSEREVRESNEERARAASIIEAMRQTMPRAPTINLVGSNIPKTEAPVAASNAAK